MMVKQDSGTQECMSLSLVLRATNKQLIRVKYEFVIILGEYIVHPRLRLIAYAKLLSTPQDLR